MFKCGNGSQKSLLLACCRIGANAGESRDPCVARQPQGASIDLCGAVGSGKRNRVALIVRTRESLQGYVAAARRISGREEGEALSLSFCCHARRAAALKRPGDRFCTLVGTP